MNVATSDERSDGEGAEQHEGAGQGAAPIIRNLERKTRNLILHLDLNNTILVCDSATGQGPRVALNSYLSTVVWGRVDSKGDWEWISDQPSISSPSPDAINYYTQFGRDGRLGDSKIGERIKEILSRHLEELRWRGEEDAMFSQRGEDGDLYHWILPSFFHLLIGLHRQRRSFAIVLRTFGTDLPNLLQSLQAALAGKHPQFPQLRDVPLRVEVTPGTIRCSKRETVLKRGEERVTTKGKERRIYDYFTAAVGIGGFQDHFDWWARHSFGSAGGKPFWIDPNDCENQHIFIDDNIRRNKDESDTIVNGRVLMDGGKSRRAATSELYDACLVQTDLLRAIADPEYFLSCVRTCEENYERFLQNLHLD